MYSETMEDMVIVTTNATSDGQDNRCRAAHVVRTRRRCNNAVESLGICHDTVFMERRPLNFATRIKAFCPGDGGELQKDRVTLLPSMARAWGPMT
jgi:hypothetical protein